MSPKQVLCLPLPLFFFSFLGESETHDVQIICVTESWLNSDIVDAEVSIPNFNLFRADRPNDTRFGDLLSLFSPSRYIFYNY